MATEMAHNRPDSTAVSTLCNKIISGAQCGAFYLNHGNSLIWGSID